MSFNIWLLLERFCKASISSREKKALKKSLGVTAISWNFAPIEKELGCEFKRLDPENLDINIFRWIDKFHSHCKRNMIDKCNKLEENTE